MLSAACTQWTKGSRRDNVLSSSQKLERADLWCEDIIHRLGQDEPSRLCSKDRLTVVHLYSLPLGSLNVRALERGLGDLDAKVLALRGSERFPKNVFYSA